MATMVAHRELRGERPTEPPRGASVRSSWAAHWPLSILFLGFPLWWALGLRTLMPMFIAVVMADQLLRRRRRLVLPAGFGVWFLFLAWVALGVLVLFADAPAAVTGGGASRLLVFAYRAAWYFTVTVMLLWVANLRESELPTRWLFQLLGYMFVVTTVGGLVGVLVPTFEFRSLVELLLPAGIRSNGLVQSIAHPAVADIQNVLGRPQARPKAPFPFANSWGSSLALYLPFFLVAWWRDGARWQRVLVPVVLGTATVPIIYSLNRGLWICLAMGFLGYLVLQVARARLAPLIVTLVLLAGVSIAFFASPLGQIFQERLNHAHSNVRRSLLLNQTVASTVEGSPIVGFGSTRRVQGSFTSIAGGDTPDCSACGLPPLGTQGHLWLVIFSQGLIGVALFLAFFLFALSRTWRCRTVTETLCLFVLVFFALQIAIYDTLGMPLITVMLAIGAVWREQVATGVRDPGRHRLAPALARLRTAVPMLTVLVLAGALVGAGLSTLRHTSYAARVAVELNQSPMSFAGTQPATDPKTFNLVTLDTESSLVTSEQTLGRALGTSDPAAIDALRQKVEVTAAPNTRVLSIEVRDHVAANAGRLADAVARDYLTLRNGYLTDRRGRAVANLERRLKRIERSARRPQASHPAAVRQVATANATRDRLQTTLTNLLAYSQGAGHVIRTSVPKRLRNQREVPVTSGAALGLAVGATLLAAFPGWVPGDRRRRRRRERRQQRTSPSPA